MKEYKILFRCETYKKLAVILGVKQDTVLHWKKHGLPSNINGLLTLIGKQQGELRCQLRKSKTITNFKEGADMAIRPDEIIESDKHISADYFVQNKNDPPETTEELHKQPRQQFVNMACELIGKGFNHPDFDGADANPIQITANWIEEALNKKQNTPKIPDQKHLLPKNMYTMIETVAKVCREEFDSMSIYHKKIEQELTRNTNLVNLLISDKLVPISDKLVTATSIELDLVGKAIERPRLNPESDNSYRRRLIARLAIRK